MAGVVWTPVAGRVPNLLAITYSAPADSAPDGRNCLICGRRLADPRRAGTIHCVEGGVSLIIPVEQAYANEAADLGFWPIGPECARRLPAGYVTKVAR